MTLENMTRRSNQQERIVNEGQWTFSFTLDRSQLPEKITLPDLQVNGVNVDTGETLPVTLTDIVLSNTGIQYKFDCNHGKIDVYGNISVLLKNQELHRTIAQLPEIQRRRVLLYYFGGYTYEQIAQMEGCKYPAIIKSVAAAEKNIKKYLSK